MTLLTATIITWTVITVTDPYLKIQRLHSIVPRGLKLLFIPCVILWAFGYVCHSMITHGLNIWLTSFFQLHIYPSSEYSEPQLLAMQ